MDDQGFVAMDGVRARLETHLPGKKSESGAPGKDNCLFPWAVLRRMRTLAGSAAGIRPLEFERMTNDPGNRSA